MVRISGHKREGRNPLLSLWFLLAISATVLMFGLSFIAKVREYHAELALFLKSHLKNERHWTGSK